MDLTLSMSQLTHFFLGLTSEWLDQMKKMMGSEGKTSKDAFPIVVKGTVEMYSLSKLFKMLSNQLPNTLVKVLKMKKQSTSKQFI